MSFGGDLLSRFRRPNEVIKIKFSTTDCQACPARSLCTQSIRHTRRTVTIRPETQYQALKQRREQEKTHLQHIATAAAFNVVRSLVWHDGLPRAQTRCSAFTRLYDAA